MLASGAATKGSGHFRDKMKILVINGGSSSFKCWLGDLAGELSSEPVQPLWTKHIDWKRGAPPADLLRPVLESLSHKEIELVGHRIVHGGQEYRETSWITPEVRAAIARQVEFAPSHNRFELEAIGCVDEVLGASVRQVAVFDTGFHETLEPAAYVYPGPYRWLEEGVRRYGFHGSSFRYAAREAARILGSDSLRLVLCHLGNGASLAAVRDGRSIDTTMGFTPLEGLMMGSRSGSIDPGIIIYLIRHRGYTADQLDRLLNQESGLRGISGLSGDMREIVDAIAAGNERAQLAFDIYAHRLCREIGAMIGVLGGVDALVFTGGVGENCAPLRERVRRQFEFLGPPRILVIHAEEEWEIATQCCQLARATVARAR